MTVLQDLISRPQSPAMAKLIAQHRQRGTSGVRMGEWGRKGQSHYKDGQFNKN